MKNVDHLVLNLSYDKTKDEFLIIASDRIWDVFSSQCCRFCAKEASRIQ